MTTRSESSIALARILVLFLPVCATVSFSYEDLLRCNDRRSPPQTLAECNYDEDCMENAYCWNQKGCYCKDGYVVYRNRSSVYCLRVASQIGDPCVTDVQCHVTFAPHSECRQDICQCSSNAHFVGERCYESVGLGRLCQTNNNCYIKDSYCLDGFCACDRNKHSNPEKTSCIKDVYLGESCSEDYECVSDNTRCMEVCKCKVDYVLSADRKQCLKAANSVGDACQENSQCKEFLQSATCGPNNVCICKENFHRRGSVCVRDATLGQRCISHRECITLTYRDSTSTDIVNVDCTNEVCTCAENYIMTDNRTDCIRFSENGATRWHAYGVFVFTSLVNLSLKLL